MHEAAKNRAVDRILGERGDEEKAFTKERQHTAQAFTLHVEWKDGRRTEGFAWSHYLGYRWVDNGGHETLTLVFGPRAVEIDGHNLGRLVEEIREGKLSSVREMNSSRQLLLSQSNPAEEPVIQAIRSYPDMDEIMKELKGENDDKAGHARRVQR
jgi:hypothetical protein